MKNEIIHTPPDSNRTSMPRESKRKKPTQGCLWNVVPSAPVEVEILGRMPKGFVEWAARTLEAHPSEVLHICSGGLTKADGGLRVDLRLETQPDVVADGRSLPLPTNSQVAALVDPPWSVEYARDLYNTEYPRPSHLLREAARVTRAGGLVGFLHFLIPSPPPGTRFERTYGITAGCGYRIRALTLFRKAPATLF